MEFGETLRAARENKGYTIRQIAEMTHMPPSTIEELEAEDFSRIAAPIYGRGFVKLYCEAVGIDPKPLVNDFMDIYSGNRDTGIRERATNGATPVSEQPRPQPTAEEPEIVIRDRVSPAVQDSLPAMEPEAPSAPIPMPIRETVEEPAIIAPMPIRETATATAPADPLSEHPEAPKPSLSRYAAPIRQLHTPTVPRSFWRMCALAIVALALLAALVFGIRALYRATSSDKPVAEESAPPQTEPPVPEKAVEANVAPAAGDKEPRTPQQIPPLYMD